MEFLARVVQQECITLVEDLNMVMRRSRDTGDRIKENQGCKHGPREFIYLEFCRPVWQLDWDMTIRKGCTIEGPLGRH